MKATPSERGKGGGSQWNSRKENANRTRGKNFIGVDGNS